VQRILKEQGARQVISIGQGGAVPPVDGASAADAEAGELSVQVGLPMALTESERELLGQVLKELLECKRLLDRAREAA
jgi:hypothetical protein